MRIKAPEFKVGNLIKCNKNMSGMLIKNKKGKIIYINRTEDYAYLVEFLENIGGHDGNGMGQLGRCYWLREKDIELIYYLKLKDKVRCTLKNHENTVEYVRHRGKLNDRGNDNSIWSDWTEKWSRKPIRVLTYLDEEDLELI